MNREYDFVFLTNTPSFYKLNLCNELARRHSLLLVLLGYGEEAVNERIEDGDARYRFDTVFLHRGNLHRRNRILVFLRLLSLMRRIRARRILFSGWFVPEFNLFSFLSPREKNVVICESSVLDSPMYGWRGVLKRSIIRRMSAALASGIPHAELFRQLRFAGRILTTGGVGLFRAVSAPLQKNPINTRRPLRYLFVGRLIAAKNVLSLAEHFRRCGKQLTIVGSGVLEEQLRAIATPNIRLMGFVPNEQLPEIYRSHDVFILPSLYEPWGLVVEEALYHGLPVIAGNRVGCAADLIIPGRTGEICPPDNPEDAIRRIESRYADYKKGVAAINWQQRKEQQLQAYSRLLD